MKLAPVYALLLLAACGGGNDNTATDTDTSVQAELAQFAEDMAAAPACADVFADGKVPEGLDDVDPMCMDPDGTAQILGAWRCIDGTHLVSVDQYTGAPSNGWYLTGQPFHAVREVAADPAYGDAMDICRG